MNLTVLSPHLDDAVFSLGATMHALGRRGIDVLTVTVFAGNPERTGRLSYWDAMSGLGSAREIFEARRAEDQRAAELLGTRKIWLPYDDAAYAGDRPVERIWAEVEAAVAGADAVLVPGWPLTHYDHRYVTLMALERLDEGVPLGLYAEQPYTSEPVTFAKGLVRGRIPAAARPFLDGSPRWVRPELTASDAEAKQAALAAYGTQEAGLGYRMALMRMYERFLGEAIAWVRGERSAMAEAMRTR